MSAFVKGFGVVALVMLTCLVVGHLVAWFVPPSPEIGASTENIFLMGVVIVAVTVLGVVFCVSIGHIVENW